MLLINFCCFHLRQDGDMVNAIIITEGPHKPIAQAGFAHANLALILFGAGNPDDRDIDALNVALTCHLLFIARYKRGSQDNLTFS